MKNKLEKHLKSWLIVQRGISWHFWLCYFIVFVISMQINPAYGGTKRTGCYQMPHILRSVWSEPGLFVTYMNEHLQKALFSLSTQFKNINHSVWIEIYEKYWSMKVLFSSIILVFPDDVTYLNAAVGNWTMRYYK